MDDTDPEGAAENAIVAAHLQSFGYLMQRIHMQWRQRLVATLEGTGLHGGHVVVLATLWVRFTQAAWRREDPGLTQTQLVQISGVEKSSLVLFLDGLEKDGWIERRKHPGDRRAHLVYLTPAGAERFAKLGLKLQAMDQENFAPFSADEKAGLMQGLTRLLVQLETLNGAAIKS